MFTAYSGTFFGAIAVAVIPQLVRYGFSDGCANEIVNIGVPFIVAGAVMLYRWSKGDVTLIGMRTDFRK
jgi:hypothetical protein